MARAPKHGDFYGRRMVHPAEIMVAGCDFETDGLGGEMLMGQWGVFGEVHIHIGKDAVRKFLEFASQWPSPVVWFIHFAQYDWRYFLEEFESGEWDVVVRMRTDNDIYQIDFRRKGTKEWCRMRDSFAIWPDKLEALAKRFCPEMPKLEIDVANFDTTNPEHVAYARRDVEILLQGLPKYFDSITELFEIDPGPTVAGTALKAWQKTLAKDQNYSADEYGPQELFIRQAYYGGIVFLTRNDVVQNCETFDINSSYPAAMEQYGVPYGKAISTVNIDQYPHGIFRVRVRAPAGLIIPILPARDVRGAMRWYAGEFETVVTNIELEFAVRHGYQILDVIEGIGFDEVVFPFEDFVSKCKWIRKHFKGEASEIIAKLMQNSLYGKYGSRRERRSLVHFSMLDELDLSANIVEPYDDRGIWYAQKSLDEEMRCKPSWATFITARARLRLLSTAYAIGPENCIYGDTDSLTVRAGFREHVDIGEEYGQFKLEKEWAEFRAIAPKVYSGRLLDGTLKGAAKGLPKKALKDSHRLELLETGKTEASTLSLDSLRIAMKRGVVKAKELRRRSSDLSNSRNYDIYPGGTVRVKSAS